jgi:hypothetical protein
VLAGILAGWARWCTRRGAARAEGMVEYALIAASVAFVAVAGWSVLRDHEVAYFGSLPVQATPASAPGALLHPTAIEPTTCRLSPPSVLLFGDPLDCNVPRVFDTLSNPADRSAPLGTITWFIDGDPIGACALATLTAESSTCQQGRISLSVTDTRLADHPHQVWAAYTAPTSNHLPSTGSQFSLFIQRWLLSPKFGAYLCQNLVTGGADTVEEGHPITCAVHVIDLTTRVPSAGTSVHWSADNSAPSNGLGLFTCASGGDPALFGITLWNPACSPRGTIDCVTDTNGECSVIYHRLNNAISRIGLPQPDTLTVWVSRPTLTRAVTVTGAAPHPIAMWQQCAPTAGNANIQDHQVVERKARFSASGTIEVQGTTVSLRCTVFVIDADSNIVLDCVGPSSPACSSPGTNPDAYAAFPPIGNVTWTSSSLAGSKTCQLSSIDVQALPFATPAPAQAPGQIASAASCPPVDITLAGSGTNLGDGNSDQAVLTVRYSGPTHRPSSFDVQVQFQR